MSSILEALRELERDRGRASGPKSTSVADAPREATSSLGAFIPLTGGLAIGVLVFGLYVWGSGFAAPAARHETPPPVASRPERPAPAAGPSWLDTAEAPRARITPPLAATASPAPLDGGAAPAAAPALPRVTATRGNGSDRQVRVESISYSANADHRTVTLLVNGRRATLRQRESIGGVEVQLIMSDGVYLQRGSEVFFVPSR